jgi:hypothetical protein
MFLNSRETPVFRYPCISTFHGAVPIFGKCEENHSFCNYFQKEENFKNPKISEKGCKSRFSHSSAHSSLSASHVYDAQVRLDNIA